MKEHPLIGRQEFPRCPKCGAKGHLVLEYWPVPGTKNRKVRAVFMDRKTGDDKITSCPNCGVDLTTGLTGFQEYADRQNEGEN